MALNESGLERCNAALDRASQMRISIERTEAGVRLIDCGAAALGGLEAGRLLAEVCLAGLGTVRLTPGDPDIWPGPAVTISTDQPVAACMASQYAGWPVKVGGYSAMGSGPMRAARGREPLFEKIGGREQPQQAIGVLESGLLPPAEVCAHIAEQCGVQPQDLTLLVAPASSLAGAVQIVSRTVETALHKLFELGFDLRRIKSGFGVAPLPPVAADTLTGIGRTNDAVLYGGDVTLWVTGGEITLQQLGPQIPSSSSPDYGPPFVRVLEKYGRDFYQIDPLLFSPAVVTLVNLETGNSFRFGRTRPDVIGESFRS